MSFYTLVLAPQIGKEPDPNTPCIEWPGRKNKFGYGTLKVNGKSVLAHRVSCEIAYGKREKGMCALHSCDNPPCVNPGHLFWGTHADNMHDAKVKGRLPSRRGENNGRAKITNAQAKEIRELFSNGVHYRTLVKRFGVSISSIFRVKNYQSFL